MIFLPENAIISNLVLLIKVLADASFLMAMVNATIALMDLEELMDNVNQELNIARSINKMEPAKNAILNIH